MGWYLMAEFKIGDRVRLDLPDETDPDHSQYHGKHGHVIEIICDDAETVTGDGQDSGIYCIQLDSGETFDARQRDLRPPIDN
jgi:hypothetical protein